MKEMTATSLRKNLFRVLGYTARTHPVKVRYKQGDSVVISYRQFLQLSTKQKKQGKLLKPLIQGKIISALGDKSEKELLAYMGIK